jgi:hypothetical protein
MPQGADSLGELKLATGPKRAVPLTPNSSVKGNVVLRGPGAVVFSCLLSC